ncbi:MAG: Hsp20/alpha crystallin family protein [Anaerolineaceae bacterium]|nr:Hsp20/alpha crystallin family protein [Anaerolineaceae bacterium]
MAYMIRRNTDFDSFRNLARFVNNFMAEPEFDRELMGFPLDVIENDKEYLVKASIAGFDPEKLEITYDNNVLSIKGEVNEEYEDAEEGKYHVREIRSGSFFRSISMPQQVDQAAISADTENGVLTVHLPKKPEVQPRKVEVKAKAHKVATGKKVVDAEKPDK